MSNKVFMKKYVLALLAVVCVALGAAAQSAKWRTTVRMTSDTEGVVTVKAIIPEGFHLYGMEMPEGGPVATSLDFTASAGVRMLGTTGFTPQPATARDDAFGMDLQWWTGTVSFTRRFKITDPETARILVKIRYMMCNGTNCLPPRTENVVIPNARLKSIKK